MKTCSHCNVEILTPRTRCPLCAGPLAEREGGGPLREAYPPIPMLYKRFNLLFRIMIFASVAVGLICLFINSLLPVGGWWSLLVLLGIGYMWIVILYGVKRIHRVGRLVLYQLVVLSVASVAIDWLYGPRGWAIDYVVPALCVFAMIALSVISVVSHPGIGEIGIYVVVNALLGIVPLIFALTGLADVRWPSLACALLSFLLFAGLFILGGGDIWQEMKKRFHV